MLTDAALRNLKPKSKIYKASDRDGMYVTVSPGGTITFRYDYRLHGRRETLTLGRHGPDLLQCPRASRIGPVVSAQSAHPTAQRGAPHQ